MQLSNVHQVPRRRNRTRTNRCLSCKRLKIKCVAGAPKCEYCEHTNRECIYIDNFSSGESDDSNSYEAVVWHQQRPLNSPLRQIGISTFECRLLKYFHEVYLAPGEMKQPPLKNLWQVQVPRLFHESPLVRSSIFSLCSLNLWNLLDLSSWIYDSAEVSTLKYMTFCNLQDLQTIPNVSEFLREKTREYYGDTLRDTSKLIQELSTEQKQLATINEAAEVVISGVLLFSFLALQTHQLLPFVSHDSSQPDLLSMCSGMKVSMAKAFPLLYNSQFSALFYKNEVLSPPPNPGSYPFVTYLLDKLEEYHNEAMVTTSQYEILLQAVDMFKILMFSSIEQNFPLPLYKWIFVAKNDIYDYVKREQLFFAIKLVYAYACMNMICKFYLKRTPNIWMEYIEWYKEYNFFMFEGWNDDFDCRLYNIVASGYTIPDEEYHLLATFFP